MQELAIKVVAPAKKTPVLVKNGSAMELRNGKIESSDSSESDSEEDKVIWFLP